MLSRHLVAYVCVILLSGMIGYDLGHKSGVASVPTKPCYQWKPIKMYDEKAVKYWVKYWAKNPRTSGANP